MDQARQLSLDERALRLARLREERCNCASPANPDAHDPNKTVLLIPCLGAEFHIIDQDESNIRTIEAETGAKVRIIITSMECEVTGTDEQVSAAAVLVREHVSTCAGAGAALHNVMFPSGMNPDTLDPQRRYIINTPLPSSGLETPTLENPPYRYDALPHGRTRGADALALSAHHALGTPALCSAPHPSRYRYPPSGHGAAFLSGYRAAASTDQHRAVPTTNSSAPPSHHAVQLPPQSHGFHHL